MSRRGGGGEEETLLRRLERLEERLDLEGWPCQTLEGQTPLGQKAGEEKGATCAFYNMLAKKVRMDG